MNTLHLVSTPDVKPHDSVQAWSRGPIFPAVIAVVETYAEPMGFERWLHCNEQLSRTCTAALLYAAYTRVFMPRPLADRLVKTEYRLSYKDFSDVYSSRQEAETAAQLLIATDEWRAEQNGQAAEYSRRSAALRAFERSRNAWVDYVHQDLTTAWLGNVKRAAA